MDSCLCKTRGGGIPDEVNTDPAVAGAGLSAEKLLTAVVAVAADDASRLLLCEPSGKKLLLAVATAGVGSGRSEPMGMTAGATFGTTGNAAT